MGSPKGTIVLMGSGELTSSMVEVHKMLLGAGPKPHRAVFLDTPAGFQLNCEQISQRAAEYFRNRVQQDLEIVSLKSARIPAIEMQQAYQRLRAATYILIGPGSPSYALRQWRQTQVPDIIGSRVADDACLAAASAAALTVGCFTLPVYEIYKAGHDLHWLEGMDVLGRFGLRAAVVPHWNNAEGGTHDTSRCFMGEARFRALEEQLPEDVLILGIDEHTACILDLGRHRATVRGLGKVWLRHRGQQMSWSRGQTFSLRPLSQGTGVEDHRVPLPLPSGPTAAAPADLVDPWQQLRELEDAFHRALENNHAEEAAAALLGLDELIWKSRQGEAHFVAQARELLRDLIVAMAMRLERTPWETAERFRQLVEEVLGVRQVLRQSRLWPEADMLRQALQKLGIKVEDTAAGPRWR